MKYIVETENLMKHYEKGKIKAVNGLNLKIKEGEIYAFIGANGSGKSTTINMITGVLKPTSGHIKVMGYDMVKNRHKLSQYIGVAPQDYSVYTDLSVEENVMFFSRMYGVKGKIARERMKSILTILRLEERRKERVKNLSGGMKRRVSIACALIHNPKILLFDEATVGVDPVLRRDFWEYFRSLKENGQTLIITSHVMDEAERADRIGLIRAGVLIEEGTPAALKNKYNAQTIEDVFLTLSGDEAVDE